MASRKMPGGTLWKDRPGGTGSQFAERFGEL
jgi:hypothetical protein